MHILGRVSLLQLGFIEQMNSNNNIIRQAVLPVILYIYTWDQTNSHTRFSFHIHDACIEESSRWDAI